MSDFSEREVVVFTEAVQLPSEERAAYLERACAGDGALRQRVEKLLKAHENAGEFLAGIPAAVTAQNVKVQSERGSIPGEKAGDRIGRYKLLQQIGEGGCGIVFMADQEEPVRRRVAIKVVKPGMDTKSVIARFEAERQALALMEHPNIAKVLDVGATETGRPFFVMELVRGIKITDYCDQNALTTADRLKLFCLVCEAVQHAHQKGIIHRDLKPSNILVMMSDSGEALPKVIDFGIAKATSDLRLTDKTLFTAFEMMVGTPAYMSPEQAALASVDVDTRTDIYSLGILLYELLTGKTPFDTHELLKAGLDEVRRVIRTQEPIRPSTRLSTMMAADLTAVAQFRQAEPPKLIRLVRGDLDWIVMKALEKDRKRRYQTALELEKEIQHFLADEPISARPPSTWYKFKKMALRNKLLFTSISIIGLLLVISLAIMAILLSGARQARLESDAARQQAAHQQQKAQAEAAKSEEVTRFLEDMLQGVKPAVANGADTTLLKIILNNTDTRIGNELTNQPEVRVELQGALGRVWQDLGNFNKAESLLRSALATRRELSGDDNPDVASLYFTLAALFSDEGRLTEANAMNDQAVIIAQKLYGTNSPATASYINQKTVLLQRSGKLAEAESLNRELLALQLQRYKADSPQIASILCNLGNILENEGKLAEAEKTDRQAVDIDRKYYGEGNLYVAEMICNLGGVLREESKLTEAEACHREGLQALRKLMDDTHPLVTMAANGLIADLVAEHKDDQLLQVLDLGLKPQLLENPDPAFQANLRAENLAQRAIWKLASKKASRAVELQPTNHLYYHTLAPLLAEEQDTDNYRKLCAVMIQHFGGTQDPFVADRMAKDCLILPLPGMDLDSAGALAQIAVTNGKKTGSFPFFCCAKALAEYRMGHFSSASEWARAAFQSPYPYVDSEADAVLAMSQYQLKNDEDARAYLYKDTALVRDQMPQEGSGDAGSDWRDWIICHLLLKEAKTLILPTDRHSEVSPGLEKNIPGLNRD